MTSVLAVDCERVELEGVKQFCRQTSLGAFDSLCLFLKFSSDVWLVNDCSPPATLGLG